MPNNNNHGGLRHVGQNRSVELEPEVQAIVDAAYDRWLRDMNAEIPELKGEKDECPR